MSLSNFLQIVDGYTDDKVSIPLKPAFSKKVSREISGSVWPVL